MIIAITGKKRTGKTTLLKTILLEVINDKKAIFIYDRRNEFSAFKYGITGNILKVNPDLENTEFSYPIKKQDSYVFIDELDLYCHRTKKDNLYELFSSAGNLNNTIFFNVKRIQEVPIFFIAQSDYICIFQHTDIRDVEYYQKRFNIDVLHIPLYHYILNDFSGYVVLLKNSQNPLFYLKKSRNKL